MPLLPQHLMGVCVGGGVLISIDILFTVPLRDGRFERKLQYPKFLFYNSCENKM